MASGPQFPPAADSIAQVIATMQAIDTMLDDADGVKWFNYLYLTVTQIVDTSVSSGTFVDPQWITALDVTFANLYFDALRAANSTGPETAPLAWRPLFKNRNRGGIARIQFALAGMNAHINRDLVFALLDLYEQSGTAPDKSSAEFKDFTTINNLLEVAEAKAKPVLIAGTPLASSGQLEPLEDLIAMWSVAEARAIAWDRSQSAWHLRALPAIQRDTLDALDRATQFAGGALLVPLLL
jgi:hypothetical protein